MKLNPTDDADRALGGRDMHRGQHTYVSNGLFTLLLLHLHEPTKRAGTDFVQEANLLEVLRAPRNKNIL